MSEKQYKHKMRKALRGLDMGGVKELVEEDPEAFQTMHTNECITDILLASFSPNKEDLQSLDQRHSKLVQMINFLKEMGVDILCKNPQNNRIYSSSMKRLLRWIDKFDGHPVKQQYVKELLMELCRHDITGSISILRGYKSDTPSNQKKKEISHLITSLQKMGGSFSFQQQQRQSEQRSYAFYTGGSILVSVLVSATIVLFALRR